MKRRENPDKRLQDNQQWLDDWGVAKAEIPFTKHFFFLPKDMFPFSHLTISHTSGTLTLYLIHLTW